MERLSPGNWVIDRASYAQATSRAHSVISEVLKDLPESTEITGADLGNIVEGHPEFHLGVQRYNQWLTSDGGRYYKASSPSVFLGQVRSVSLVTKRRAPDAVASAIQPNYRRIS